MKVASRLLVTMTVAILVVIAVLAASHLPSSPSSATTTPPPPPEPSACPRSTGLCIERNVTRVIDGDTLVVEGDLHVRLVLVDAPELNATGGPEAKDRLTSVCLGRLALVDEDDDQLGADPYGRVLAVVTCDGTNANGEMIASGLAKTYYSFCSASEFRNEPWTGCSSAPRPGNCDPSYPDVCIPPPPPDLNCNDIPYRRFRVLPPDPHHFDLDGDGIGCESG